MREIFQRHKALDLDLLVLEMKNYLGRYATKSTIIIELPNDIFNATVESVTFGDKNIASVTDLDTFTYKYSPLLGPVITINRFKNT